MDEIFETQCLRSPDINYKKILSMILKTSATYNTLENRNIIQWSTGKKGDLLVVFTKSFNNHHQKPSEETDKQNVIWLNPPFCVYIKLKSGK